MAKIIPFKAVRPATDKVALVTCRTYDDYSDTELAAWLTINPYSFLHVIHPAYTKIHKNTPEKRFKKVANKYQDFKEDQIFVSEEQPVFYLYEIQSKGQIFTGIIAGASVQDYQNNAIKKHEDTLKFRVELLKDFLKITNFNTEPVLITYPDSSEISAFIALRKHKTPIYQYATTNREQHTLWKIETESEINWLQEHFENIPNLYIADGHHRSASAALLYDENKNTEPNNEKIPFFMSFLIAESNVKIYEFNRLIRDLNGLSKVEFIKKISENFIVKLKNQEIWKPQNKNEFAMYLDGEFYALYFQKEHPEEKGILENLDAQILYDKVLFPILGLEDLRNDERIAYIPGKQSISVIKDLIDEGEFEVGFILFPSNIQEIKQIADANLIMPPKSTYIEPKFRSGLVVYEL